MFSKTTLIISVLLLALVAPVGAVSANIWGSRDLPKLEEEQGQILPLFKETARLIEPSFQTPPYLGDSLRPDFSPQTDPFGYDECDYWWNVFRPGWFTDIFYDFDLAQYQSDELVTRIIALWSNQGGDVLITGSPIGQDGSRVQLTLGYSIFALEFSQQRNALSLLAMTTECLPLS